MCMGTGIWTASSVLGALLAQKVLFTNVIETDSLVAVQWTYLGTAISTAILALGLHYIPLPEATDRELEV